MNNTEDVINHFESLLRKQYERLEFMKDNTSFINYNALNKIIIGVAGGDGIGPSITSQAQRLLEYLLSERIKEGKVEIRYIDGLTIENRVKEKIGIPFQVLQELKKCNVILKGPTTTPREGDGLPNIESANVAMRKELDLFANVRPVQVPEQDIDWVFFRENTEGAYAVGNNGITVMDDLAIDFTITTKPGTIRIIRSAFEYAHKHNKKGLRLLQKLILLKILMVCF